MVAPQRGKTKLLRLCAECFDLRRPRNGVLKDRRQFPPQNFCRQSDDPPRRPRVPGGRFDIGLTGSVVVLRLCGTPNTLAHRPEEREPAFDKNHDRATRSSGIGVTRHDRRSAFHRAPARCFGNSLTWQHVAALRPAARDVGGPFPPEHLRRSAVCATFADCCGEGAYAHHHAQACAAARSPPPPDAKPAAAAVSPPAPTMPRLSQRQFRRGA